MSWLVRQLVTAARVGDWVGEDPVAVGVWPRIAEGDELAELEQPDSVTSNTPIPRASARLDSVDRVGIDIARATPLSDVPRI
jgi:hypothetical protein